MQPASGSDTHKASTSQQWLSHGAKVSLNEHRLTGGILAGQVATDVAGFNSRRIVAADSDN